MPTSNHPPRMIKGIIYSLMRNYKRQTTHHSDYKEMAVKLFERHVARGWDRSLMKKYIMEADTRLINQPTTPPTRTYSQATSEHVNRHSESPSRELAVTPRVSQHPINTKNSHSPIQSPKDAHRPQSRIGPPSSIKKKLRWGNSAPQIPLFSEPSGHCRYQTVSSSSPTVPSPTTKTNCN